MTEAAGEHHPLYLARQERLRSIMRDSQVPALLTSDPINICYATGARNMTVFGMMGPSRFLLLFAEGPSVLFEFAGCEHLAAGLPTIDRILQAPGITALAGPSYRTQIDDWCGQLAGMLQDELGRAVSLAVERLDFPVSDALREHGIGLLDAGPVFTAARLIKLPQEMSVMREAIRRVDDAAHRLEDALDDGVTEIAVWSEFHRHLIATEGEYVSTRLLQGGMRTFPYFQEAGNRPVRKGELLCFDTDALGYGGYAVDFSRTFICGAEKASDRQRELYRLAYDQLMWNAEQLKPGIRFEDFARAAWPVPERYRQWGYYCLAHGLGLCGEYPYIPKYVEGRPYGFEGLILPGMVLCIESYIGSELEGEGVKLENQFLITETGAECLTGYGFSDALLSREF